MRRSAKVGLILIAVAAAIAGTGLLIPRLPPFDFVEYWSAAHLYVSGHNPYSLREMMWAEQQAGWTVDHPLPFYNPPWFLPLIAPLGYMRSFTLARALWFWMSIALLALCLDRLWRFYGGPQRLRWIAFVIAAFFFPNWYCLALGQLGPLLLVGVVGFLVFQERGSDLLAGASLALLTVKPHLFYLGWISLVVWTFQTRRWRVLASCCATVLVASAVCLWFDAAAFWQYRSLMATGYMSRYMSGFGGILRDIFGPQHLWLQFTPMLPGSIGFIWYWHKQRSNWQWRQRLPVVLTLSVLTASYGWPNDEPLLLLPVVAVAVGCIGNAQRLRTAADCFVAISMASFAAAVKFHQAGAMVVPPLGILLYVIVTAWQQSKHGEKGGEELRPATAQS